MTAHVDPAGGTATSTIVPFARSATGRLEQNGAAAGPMPANARGIIVNPQGTRVYYGHPGNAIFFRNINADGTLGAENSFPLAPVAPIFPPFAQFLAMTPDGRNLYAAQFEGRTGLIVWQSTIDPATGLGTPKDPASVAFPNIGGAAAALTVGRMAVTPSGSHLYVASDTANFGIGGGRSIRAPARSSAARSSRWPATATPKPRSPCRSTAERCGRRAPGARRPRPSTSVSSPSAPRARSRRWRRRPSTTSSRARRAT